MDAAIKYQWPDNQLKNIYQIISDKINTKFFVEHQCAPDQKHSVCYCGRRIKPGKHYCHRVKRDARDAITEIIATRKTLRIFFWNLINPFYPDYKVVIDNIIKNHKPTKVVG
jgi:hypothetical protein